MGKIITYIVFGLIGCFFFFGPGVGLYLVSKKPIEALSYQGRKEGIVTRCRSKRVKATSSSNYIKSPVVKLADGRLIYGSTDEVRFFAPCDKLIGQTLSVRYDLDNPRKSKINTFHEMWFMPMSIGLMCLLFYGALGFAFLRSKT